MDYGFQFIQMWNCSLRTAKQIPMLEKWMAGISVLDTPALGKVPILNGHTLVSDADDFVYNEMTVHVPHGCPPNPKKVWLGWWRWCCLVCLYPELEQIDIGTDEMLVEVCRSIPRFAGVGLILVSPFTTKWTDFEKLRRWWYYHQRYMIHLDIRKATKEFYRKRFRALKRTESWSISMESLLWRGWVSFASIHRKSIKHLNQLGLSGAHPNQSSWYWLFGFASKNTTCQRFLTRKAGKTPAFTEYYTCKLTWGLYVAQV